MCIEYCFLICSRSQKMNSTEEKLLQIQTAIVELLIRNAERIGLVSNSLAERTSLLAECFGTEDELDGASDDNTLEDSKDKKRRKRSSSLQGLGRQSLNSTVSHLKMFFSSSLMSFFIPNVLSFFIFM